MATTNYGIANSRGVGNMIDPSDHNDQSNCLDNQLGALFAMQTRDGVISGFAIATDTGLQVSAGEAIVGGAHVKTAALQAITGITANTTNYIYAVRKAAAASRVSESFTLGSVNFEANTTGVAPANGILLATGVVDSGGTAFSSVDNAPAGRPTALLAPAVLGYTAHATPGTESAVAHGLGRVPKGYIVIKRDAAGIVYTGTTPWTSTNIYLAASTAGLVTTILVF